MTLATNELLLVTTDDCHFCVRAHEVLDAVGVAAREMISVDSPEAAWRTALPSRARRARGRHVHDYH